jgi:hypothetical protein
MSPDVLPTSGPPVLLRDGEGRLVAVRALPDADLLAFARLLIDEEADFHLALVRDALALGAAEDEARALLDADPEELRLRADPSWASVRAEIRRRGLPEPKLPPLPPRDLAEIDGLLLQAAAAGKPSPPASLEAGLSCRARRRLAGGTVPPLAWVDFVRRHDGLRLGGLHLLGTPRIEAAPPLSGWTAFGVSGRGTVIHAIDAAGRCAAWRSESLRDGVPSGRPRLTAPDFVSYLERLLPRALERVVRRGG